MGGSLRPSRSKINAILNITWHGESISNLISWFHRFICKLINIADIYKNLQHYTTAMQPEASQWGNQEPLRTPNQAASLISSSSRRGMKLDHWRSRCWMISHISIFYWALSHKNRTPSAVLEVSIMKVWLHRRSNSLFINDAPEIRSCACCMWSKNLKPIGFLAL